MRFKAKAEQLIQRSKVNGKSGSEVVPGFKGWNTWTTPRTFNEMFQKAWDSANKTLDEKFGESK